jgi:hypothetical protein
LAALWGDAHETGHGVAGSLAEGEPKLDSRHGTDQGLVDVFHGLDEVGLSEDEIRRIRLVDPEL